MPMINAFDRNHMIHKGLIRPEVGPAEGHASFGPSLEWLSKFAGVPLAGPVRDGEPCVCGEVVIEDIDE